MNEQRAIADALRAFLGDDRYRKLVGQLRDLASQGARELRWWHSRALEEFETSSPTRLPRLPGDFAALLTDSVPEPPSLAEDEVPDWIEIRELGGVCPVQGLGSVLVSEPDGRATRWQWYFRARWDHWHIGAAADGTDPVDVSDASSTTFFHEEPYECGTGESDAGYMPEAAARFYIVRELRRLRAAGSG